MTSLLDQKPGAKKKAVDQKAAEVMGGAPAETAQSAVAAEVPALAQQCQPAAAGQQMPAVPGGVGTPVSGSTCGDVCLNENEIKLSLVKIVQPTSKDGTAGMFRNVETGQEYDKLTGFILDRQSGFVDFGPQDYEHPFMCASRDMITCRSIEGEDIDPRACPRNPVTWDWKDKKPSRCRFTYNFIFNSEEDDVFVLAFHQASSYDAIKTFLTQIATKATGRKVMNSGRTPGKYYLFPVTITLKEEKNDKGKFYVAQFVIGDEIITEADEKFLAARAQTLSTVSTMDKMLDHAVKEDMPSGRMPGDDDCPID